MSSILIVIGILFIISVIVIFKIAKTIAKTMFFSFSLLAILFFIFTFLVVSDVRDLNENFQTQPSLYVFQQDSLTAAVSGVFSGDTEELITFSKSDLDDLNNKYPDLNAIKGNNYKLFIIHEDTFSQIQEVDFNEDELSKEQILTLIASDTPLEDYVDIVTPSGLSALDKAQVKQSFMKDLELEEAYEFKSYLLLALFQAANEQQGPAFLIENIKNDNIEIYKETIAFRLLTVIPNSVFETLLGEK